MLAYDHGNGFRRIMIDNLHRAGIALTRGGDDSCDDKECREVVGRRKEGSFQVIDDDNKL
jgi:hypothetical protein